MPLMKNQQLMSLISRGETTTVQLKRCVDDAYKIATEMVAFSNSFGGQIIIGVDDKSGEIMGLSYSAIQQTNALLANAASENVKPAILIYCRTAEIDGKNLIVVTVPEGNDKPYKDNKGIIWVKNGSDKRKVFSNSELRVMMQRCGTLSADTDSVEKTSYTDINEKYLKRFLYEKYTSECNKSEIHSHTLNTTKIDDIVKAIDANLTIEKLLVNTGMMDDQGRLTLSGLLLLGNSIQKYKPVFTVKCVSFVGKSVASNEFRDKMPDSEVEGNLLDQYNAMISFVNRNLKSVQVEENFNSIARLEIPLTVFVEIGVNALLHRDYYQNSPIRVFIFDDRVEIHSPGILPHSVTEQSIKNGISQPRNELLFSNAKHILPYTGVGSGIVRAMKSYDNITFKNNYITEEFVTTIHRPEIEGSDHDGVYDSVYDSVHDSVHDGNYDSNYGSNHDGNYDGNYDSNYDEKILAFTAIPKSRKEIMNLLCISAQTKNYERHIVPLLEKGLLAMTVPDKPKSKNQKYVTTERGSRVFVKKYL